MIREALSAQIDGEDPGLPSSDLESHLMGCAACREWQRHAHAVTRRARLGGSFLDHDLTPRVLAAVPAAASRRRLRVAQRGALAALALAQLAVAAPMLLLGHGHDAGMHAAHELGSFNLALAIAFAVGAVRPKLSAGLSWPCVIAAAGLVTTAIADLIGGQAIGADEAQHLIAFAGAALLVGQSRMNGAGSTGPGVVTGEGPAGSQPGTARGNAIAWLDDTADRPMGGDAARMTGPDIAAQATSRPAGNVQAATRYPAAAGPAVRRPDTGNHAYGVYGVPDQRDGRESPPAGPGGRTHDEAVA